MKVTFEIKPLLKVLEFLSISDRKTEAAPHVEQLFVSVTDGQATLLRYGANVRKQCQTACQGDDMTFQIHYETFKGICRRCVLQHQFVDLSLLDEQMHLKAGKMECYLISTTFSEPETAQFEASSEICVNKADLFSLLQRAKVASAKNDVRYVLNGVLLETDDEGTLRAIGCDGHRLAVSYTDYLAHNYREQQLILSNDTIRYVEDAIKHHDEENIVIYFNASSLSVKMNGASLHTSIVDGKYPDWRRTISLQTRSHIQLNREELLVNLQLASALMSGTKLRNARFKFGCNGLSISAKGDVGCLEDSIVPVGFEGEELEVGLNIDYLTSACLAIDCDVIELSATSANHGVLIREQQNSKGVQVIMPVRL